jgi:hypothetical protein
LNEQWRNKMAAVIAWSLFALGLAHFAFGIRRFRVPLAAAFKAGFVGQFAESEERRSAFWFLICAPLIMVAGQVAVHAVATGDPWLLRLIGGYLFVTAAIGIAAFPKSPFWAALVLAPLLIAAGYGWI